MSERRDRAALRRPTNTPAPLRWLLSSVGGICVGLGVLGIFVPLLPTTPFLLVAAACFVRSSDRLYQRLITHRTLGPYIRNYREHRAITRRARIVTSTPSRSVSCSWGSPPPSRCTWYVSRRSPTTRRPIDRTTPSNRRRPRERSPRSRMLLSALHGERCGVIAARAEPATRRRDGDPPVSRGMLRGTTEPVRGL
jgi:uncharacterized membrane protein YbaN (DUF454 family)